METAECKLTRGGAFILEDTKAQNIFTPEEFNSGHIPASINIDYKAENLSLIHI